MRKIGIRDVALLADVSNGTVSHYLNHPDRVSAEKAERIQRAIDTLGFVPNSAGRQLRLGRSNAIAYLAPDVSNPFFSSIAEGVEKRAAEAGLSVFIANTHANRAREDAYLQMFEQHRVRGMLIASYEPIEERLAQVRSRGTPTVLFGRPVEGTDLPYVAVDEVLGGRLATEHLLDLGRQRLAFIGGPLGIKQVGDRLQGASDAVRESGAATLEVINVPERTIAGGHAVARELLVRPVTLRPDGIFAVNDLLAIGMLQTLIRGGVRVPDDVALIGYDDIEFAAASIVPISSIRSPHETFGAAAVDLLLGIIDGSAEETGVVYEPEVAVRESTAS